MSFSSEVKKELAEVMPSGRHCLIAELAAVIVFSGRIKITESREFRLFIHTENIYVTKKFYDLIMRIFGIRAEVSLRTNRANGSKMYTASVRGEAARKALEIVKLLTKDGDIRDDVNLVSNLIVQNVCCKKAFIRGAFLSAGSFGDPQKGYHFEIVAQEEDKALGMMKLVNTFGLNAKVAKRKKHYPVYLKEGEQLSDILGVMEAGEALMEYENVRILKDIRNQVNRKVNCEAANIKKTADAALRQKQDIEFLKEQNEFKKLSENLKELAELRLLYEDASLKELGEHLRNPIGKSGVNHRLNKISEIAEEIRVKKGIK